MPAPMTIGRRRFAWGERTFVMGIVNVTPDSFSGDGLLADAPPGPGNAAQSADPSDPIGAAVAQARSMVADGADLLDVGGESTRPGHDEVATNEEIRRVVPVIEAIRRALPAAELAARWRRHGLAGNVVVEPDPDRALDRVLSEGDGPIVVAGSLYLVGAVRARLVDDPLLRDPVTVGAR
jgi:hypothetical protein